ncbi:MAG: hypothetical protein K8F91_27105, partial [Candidatus Obscuribacterales bacterium]|nr:hypothetical protein [Candidatus Obscuribacterales bacterium]
MLESTFLNMLLRLKIFHYGLLLVAFPLICELGFVSVLTLMLADAEKDLQREIASKEIIYTAGVFGRYIAECATVAAAYSTTKSEFFKDRYENNKKGYRRSLIELERLVKEKGDPEQIKRIKNIGKIADDG